MKRIDFIPLFYTLVLAAAIPLSANAKARTSNPKIVVILADDMEYGDAGCYNVYSKIPTPHLDKMAVEGMRFTDAMHQNGFVENTPVIFTSDKGSFAPVVDNPITVRVASYNVEFGKSATPEQIGEMFKPYKLDIIGFDEVPDGDWTARVGKVLGMEYCYVGRISSANHKNKYKSILSRTPLEGTEELQLTGRGWNPASVVRAVTQIDGVYFAFYSLHICKSGATDGHAYHLATKVLPKENKERVIVVGDFNNNIGDAAMSTVEGSGFKTTWEDLQIDVSREFTYNAQNPETNLGVIDHILYNTSAEARVTDGGIIELEKPLSDHKPIWAQILFPRNLKKVAGFQAEIDASSKTRGK